MHLINNLNRAQLTYFDQKLKKKSLVGREFRNEIKVKRDIKAYQ